MQLRTHPLAATALFAAACTPATLPSGGYCAPPVSATWTFHEDEVPPSGAGRTERMAALLGLRDALLERRASGGAAPPASKLQVVERLELARVAIAATSAELACEGERADQAADYLTRRRSQAVQELTVASVLAATFTSIAGVLLSTSDTKAGVQDAAAIGGGAVTAGLGLASLYVRPRVAFTHPHNLLADIWRGPATSSSYPFPVWGYLTRREFSNNQLRPIREHIIARWGTFETVEKDRSEVELLFGAGGDYDVGSLRMRAAMLDQVKAEVDLENQDLAVLVAELVR